MPSNPQKQSYITAIDGLRAFAVLAVLAYHFSFSWAGGGFLGVDVFFVISGYLITSQILSKQEKGQNFSLREFWIKRARRLIPAAYAMIITVFIWASLFNREMITAMLGDGLSSIIYASNWWFIFHKLSYFDSFGSPSPFKNLWSLAIEGQFYVVWPFLMIIGLKVCKDKAKFGNIVLIGALSSALLMGILYQPGFDPSRVYYGTDTRAFELLIGGWLAIIYPMERLSVKISEGQGKALSVAGAIALTVFVLSVIFINEYQVFLYRGGMLLISLNAALLIASVSHPNSFLGQLLSWKPLSWIGKRSYGIYLWHYPVTVLSTPVHEIGNPVYWRVLVQLIIVLILADFSYRFIETPIRKHGFSGFLKNCLTMSRFSWRGMPFARAVSLMVIPPILVFGIIICTKAAINGQIAEKVEKPQAGAVENSKERPATSEDLTIPDEKGESGASSTTKSYNKILAIGDSILLDISQQLSERFPNIKIDAKIGRHLYQAVELAPAYADYNAAGSAVIIELGTNSYFTDKQIDSLLSSFAEADVYLVNVRVPRQWEKEVNKALARKAQENEYVTLIDWYSVAINHPEYFEQDGVHLKPNGAEALASLIAEAVSEDE